MTTADFLKILFPTLFGATTAFLLGMVAQARANAKANSTAGNLALITLGQMYTLMESLRYQLFVDEVARQTKLLGGKPPYEFHLRGVSGMPSETLRVRTEQLGFLAASHDPDVLNRLISVDRAFTSMLDMVNAHRDFHQQMQERMEKVDKTGDTMVSPAQMPSIVGMPLFVHIVQIVRALKEGLPETRDAIHLVSQQLHEALRMQYPAHRFLKFDKTGGRRALTDPRGIPTPLLRRRVLRWIVELLTYRIGPPANRITPVPHESEPPIRTFILSTDDSPPISQ